MNKKHIYILLAVVAIVAIAAFTMQKSNTSEVDVKPQSSNSDLVEWDNYYDEEYGFAFDLPSEANIYNCSQYITSSHLSLRMDFSKEKNDLCNVPGKAVPHLLTVDLSTFRTAKNVSDTVERIRNQVGVNEFYDNEINGLINIKYVINKKDDEGNTLFPKEVAEKKQSFVPIDNDLYLSFSLTYDQETNDYLKTQYDSAFNDLLESIKK